MDNNISMIYLFRRFHIFTILLFVLALTSCSHVRRQDGPPNFYVDETKIPNAKPKVEPLAKYGNMSVYRVFGKKYYTLKSSRNYEQVGIASWYGTKFHSQRTSSGERYNMLAMTAAHKTLPLPTYVEVTNLKNHRQIIVKVNDRGPFEGNRLIDLSYVAAKKLGMLGHGTTVVKIKAIDPKTYGHENLYVQKTRRAFQSGYAQNTAISKPAVYLQVGAFRNKAYAQKLQQRLTALLETPVKIARPQANSKLYRVQVGPIHDVATAKKISQQLQGLGIKSNKT